jgi:hypothetical protein
MANLNRTATGPITGAGKALPQGSEAGPLARESTRACRICQHGPWSFNNG